MAKKKEDIEELEDEEVEETETSETKEEQPKQKDFKDIVIETCTGVINRYIEMVKAKGEDLTFIYGLEDKEKTIEKCINYIMNNLTSKRIYGGDDSLMYPYIHDYYVDNLKDDQTTDNWSSLINTRAGSSTGGAKAQAKEEAKKKITEEQKQKFYEEALLEAKREAQIKAAEKIRLEEEKRKKREDEKKKLEEEKKKAEYEEAKKNNGGIQTSIFDF